MSLFNLSVKQSEEQLQVRNFTCHWAIPLMYVVKLIRTIIEFHYVMPVFIG